MKKICIFLAIVIVSMTIASAGGIDSLYISGDNQGNVGDDVTININAKNVVDISGLQIDLLYNPKILSTDNSNVTIGDLIANKNLLQSSVDNSIGKITLGSLSLSNGNGIIAKIKFKVIGSGSSPLNITITKIRDTEDNIINPNVTNSTFEGIGKEDGNGKGGKEQPEFTFTADKQSANVDVGVNAVYKLTLVNTGNDTDTYDLTTNNPNNATISISSKNFTLTKGKSKNVTLNVGSSKAGTYTVDVIATSKSDPTKSKTITTTTTISSETTTPTTGLSFTVDKQSANVNIGEDAQYILTIKNTGNNSDTYNLTVTEPDNVNVTLSQDSITLDANDTGTIEMNVDSNIAGTYNVNVTATPKSDATKTKKITTTTTVATVSPMTGFSFTVDNNFKITGPGSVTTYNLTIKNNGNKSDTYNITIDNLDNASVSLSSNNFTLASGKSKNVTLNVGSSIAGLYVVNVTATPKSDPTQSQTIRTITDVTIGEILTFGVTNGTRGGYVRANVTIGNFDNQTHLFAVVVSGTDQNGNPIVGTGVVRLNADRAIRVPVIAAVPSSIPAGQYKLYAGIFLYDNETIDSTKLIGNLAGPRITNIS